MNRSQTWHVFAIILVCWMFAFSPSALATTFSTSDLAGTWYFYIHGDSPSSNAPFWSRGTVTVNSFGIVTVGNVVDSAGGSQTIAGGLMVLSAGGVGSGFLNTLTGDAPVIDLFKLDSSKSFGSGAITVGGNQGILLFIKAGGTFSNSDLAGTWHVYSFRDNTTSNQPGWSRATVTVNGTGTITGGSSVDSDGGAGSVTGSVAITLGGVISGSVPNPIDNYKMDINKRLFAGVSTDGDTRELMIGIKGGGTFSTSDLAGIWQGFGRHDSTSSNQPGWDIDTTIVNPDGTIAGGAGADSSSDTWVVTGGSLSMAATGLFSGTITSSDAGGPKDGSFSDFKMDFSKTIFVGVDSGSSDRSLMVGIKAEVLPVIPTKIGIFRDGLWFLDVNGNGAWDGCGTDKCISWGGDSADKVVVGDWNGDGHSKVGIYRAGNWYLDFNGNGVFDGCGIDTCIAWGGDPADIPVVGDWNGDGRTKIGIYRNGVWYLDANGNGLFDGCGTDKCISWGGDPADKVVVGDWNGDSRAKIGIYRNGTWFLDANGNGLFDGCGTDKCIGWGGDPSDVPVLGNWDGETNGRTKIGIYRNGVWYLDANGNGLFDVCGTDKCISWGGDPADKPVVGDWNGDGKTKIGIFRAGTWFLDYNGNGTLDGCGTDQCIGWGGSGDTAVVGRW